MALPQPGKKLRELFARDKKVLSIFGIPNALHAIIMEKAGMEAGFVGGAGTTGNYTGFPNASVASMTELVMIGGYVARSVNFPIMLDGDTGPASDLALCRMVEDCIRAGIACLRFEDQLPGLKKLAHGEIELLPRKQAAARFRNAVKVRDSLDPSFVIGAKTYARNANAGGLQEGIDRLNMYRDVGVDTVHFQSPHTLEEVKEIRTKVAGVLAMIKGPAMTLEKHVDLGVQIAWFTGEANTVLQVAMWEFMKNFMKDGVGAWQTFCEEHVTSLAEIEKLQLLKAPHIE